MKTIRTVYKTKQRGLILEFLKLNENRHITVDIIEEHLRGRVGLTTIYRTLELLVNEGVIIKYNAPNGIGACYQYVKDIETDVKWHHLLCNGCGQMFHVNCGYLNDLTDHIKKEHSFRLNNIILHGSCEKCCDR